MPVRDYCRANPCTASRGDTIREAAKRMDATGTGCLVVVDDASKPVGILTDRDVVVRVLRRRLNPDTTTVGEVMQGDVSTLSQGLTLVAALRRMRSDGLRRLPVVDERGSLVGILSADDALQLMASELADAAAVVRAQFPPDPDGRHAIGLPTEG